ncbi:MAG TPA: hypothetical protein PKZ36_00180 [Candidatus Paceibacterota bacterium]|nr:hypothetical protein [Candidatus Paceibacterota bacterium]HPT17821.1 hypothetical protein [Candidatus Paceibacterota bacterium]
MDRNLQKKNLSELLKKHEDAASNGNKNLCKEIKNIIVKKYDLKPSYKLQIALLEVKSMKISQEEKENLFFVKQIVRDLLEKIDIKKINNLWEIEACFQKVMKSYDISSQEVFDLKKIRTKNKRKRGS